MTPAGCRRRHGVHDGVPTWPLGSGEHVVLELKDDEALHGEGGHQARRVEVLLQGAAGRCARACSLVRFGSTGAAVWLGWYVGCP